MPIHPGDLSNINKSREDKKGVRPPSGGYPRDSYKKESNVNAGARGLGNQNLKTSGSWDGTNSGQTGEPTSRYGQAQIMETPGGHIIEYNDTPGSERIMFRHVSGSGIEMRPDGSILISASSLIFDVQGDETHSISGHLNHRVGGDLNEQIAGDISLDAGGNIVQDTGGTLITKVAQGSVTNIQGSQATTVSGESIQTNLGPRSEMNLAGYQNNVKGDMHIRAEGDMGIYGSSNLQMTAQKRASISSVAVALTGDQMEIVSNRGTIGGANVIAYAYNAYIGKTLYAGDTVDTQTVRATESILTPYTESTVVKAEGKFLGDLDGVAFKAQKPGVYAGTGDIGTHLDNDTKATAAADENIISARQKTANNGVKIVKIDPGDYIRASIDRASNNGLVEATTA